MDRSSHSVKEIVNNALKGSRLLKQGIIKGNWEKIIGPELGRRTYVDSMKERILYINTENPVMLHQLSFIKGDIIEKVNSFLGIDYVKEVFFKVKKREVQDIFSEEQEEDEFDPNEIKISESYKNVINDATKDIEDIDIKNKIKKIMELSKKKEKFLLNEGNKKCVICGIIFSGKSRMCINCYNERRKEKISEIYEYIKKHPYANFKEINKILPELEECEYEDIKTKIKEKFKINMYKEINKDNEDGFRYYARIYFILETGIKEKFEIERLVNSQLLQFE